MRKLWLGIAVVAVTASGTACSGSIEDSTAASGSGGTGKGGSATGGAHSGGTHSGGTGGAPSGGAPSGGAPSGGTSATGGAPSGGAAGTPGTGGGNTGGGPSFNPICLGSQAGAYCGGDAMQDADPNVLYQCPGANQAPTSSTPCANGCVVEQQGTADHCGVTTSPDGYRLPWKPGVTMQLTQDCNDSCCNDHVNDDGYAWDFANGGSFAVVAARGGTVTHLKINSTTGCATSACVDDANVIVIDHGDGTQSTYLHLQGMSLAGGITCGGSVQRGQVLAQSGTTGWSTGIHLHFQVSQTHPGVGTCECGGDGTGCSATTVPWGSFWSTPTYPTVAIQFDEWPEASSCADRRITMPASQNQ